jgi:excisionase family DNA binding protein
MRSVTLADVEMRPPADDKNPALVLAEALTAVIRQAVRDAMSEAVEMTDNVTLISVSEAAQRLGLGMTKLRELIASGEVPSVVIGKRRLLRPQDLEAFAARQASGD